MHRCRLGCPHSDAAGSTAVTVAVRGDAELPSSPGRTLHPLGLRRPRHHPRTAPAASAAFVASVGIAVTGSFPPRSSLGRRTFAVVSHHPREWLPYLHQPVIPGHLRVSTVHPPRSPWRHLLRLRTAPHLQHPLLAGTVLLIPEAVTVNLLRYP